MAWRLAVYQNSKSCQKRFTVFFLLLSVVVFGGRCLTEKPHSRCKAKMDSGGNCCIVCHLQCVWAAAPSRLLGIGTAKKTGVIAFLSAISYSFYLWHQSIAVWLKTGTDSLLAGLSVSASGQRLDDSISFLVLDCRVFCSIISFFV